MKKSTQGIVTITVVTIAIASSGCATEVPGEEAFDGCYVSGKDAVCHLALDASPESAPAMDGVESGTAVADFEAAERPPLELGFDPDRVFLDANLLPAQALSVGSPIALDEGDGEAAVDEEPRGDGQFFTAVEQPLMGNVPQGTEGLIAARELRIAPAPVVEIPDVWLAMDGTPFCMVDECRLVDGPRGEELECHYTHCSEL